MWFQVYGRGVVGLELFEAVRWGGIIGLMLTGIILFGIAISALIQREEAKFRLLFVFGGLLGINWRAGGLPLSALSLD